MSVGFMVALSGLVGEGIGMRERTAIMLARVNAQVVKKPKAV